MDEDQLREKTSLLRQQIKERMQQEFERRKHQIKARIKEEQIPVHEKRRKYHRAMHEQKLALMKQANDEFKARKRMLGFAREGAPEETACGPPPIPPDYRKEDQSPPLPEIESAPPPQAGSPHPPAAEPAAINSHRADEAFIYEDEEDTDAREFERPIDASDMLPMGAAADIAPAGSPLAKEVAFEVEERKSIFYYIVNLVIHPVQTLDEFDDYLTAPRGLLKVLLFYALSLLPLVGFIFFSEDISYNLPKGTMGAIIGSRISPNAGIATSLMSTVAGLILYTAIIAAVNAFFADDANFLTLLLYFAFTESVTRIIVYSFVVLTVLAAVMAAAAPVVLVILALLFLAFFIWWSFLNIIVLMTAYGYDWWSAGILIFVSNRLQAFARSIIFIYLAF